MTKENTKKIGGNILVAVAIVIAALIIGAAVVFTNNSSDEIVVDDGDSEVNFDFIREITDADYVKGNLNAPVKILEFSDTECPFCGRLQNTLNEVVAEYGDSVAWAYRHLPLHSKSATESHATECAAELGGGDEAFWTYIDRIYEISPFNDGLDSAELFNVAEYAGLNKDEFTACMENQGHITAIKEDYEEGIKLLKYLSSLGIQAGTPTSLVMGPNGEVIPINGSQPKEVWQQTIDSLLAE